MKSKILFTILILAGIGFFFLNQNSILSSINKNTHKDDSLVNELLFSELAETLLEEDQYDDLLKTLVEKKIITEIEKSEYEKALNNTLKELTILRNAKKDTQNTKFQSEKTKALFLSYIEIDEELKLSTIKLLQNIIENYEKYNGKFLNKIPALVKILQKNDENYNKFEKVYFELIESLKKQK